MLPLAVDPSSVVAGWIPLALVLLLALVSVFLFFSMRKQMRRIDIPEDGIETRPGRDGEQEHVEHR